MTQLEQSHFDDYTNLQHCKHKIIHEYLNGWFPKLGFTSGRILYLDTHSGPGKYKTGQYGSPLVAIKTFLEHNARERILKNCYVDFVFMEQDITNASILKQELQDFGELPDNVTVKVICENSFEYLEELQSYWEKSKTQLPPSFMFIDPFGFTIPCNLLKRLKSHPRSEILINVMWRELDMSLRQKKVSKTWESKLDSIFGGGDWKDVRMIDDLESRVEETVKLFRRQIDAKWATHIKMLGDNNVTRYYLLHLTDNDKGRELIKNVFWKCCPDGDWEIKKTDSIDQLRLFQKQTDVNELQNWLLKELGTGGKRLDVLEKSILAEIWLPKHLWQIIKEMSEDKRIRIIGPKTKKANPLIALPEN